MSNLDNITFVPVKTEPGFEQMGEPGVEPPTYPVGKYIVKKVLQEVDLETGEKQKRVEEKSYDLIDLDPEDEISAPTDDSISVSDNTRLEIGGLEIKSVPNPPTVVVVEEKDWAPEMEAQLPEKEVELPRKKRTPGRLLPQGIRRIISEGPKNEKECEKINAFFFGEGNNSKKRAQPAPPPPARPGKRNFPFDQEVENFVEGMKGMGWQVQRDVHNPAKKVKFAKINNGFCDIIIEFKKK